MDDDQKVEEGTAGSEGPMPDQGPDEQDPISDDGHPRALPDQATPARGEDEDDDGYDPWSDRRPSPEPLYESDPWS